MKKKKYLEEYTEHIADILWLSNFTGLSSSQVDLKKEEPTDKDDEIVSDNPKKEPKKIDIDNNKQKKGDKPPEIEIHTPQNETKNESKLKKSAKAFQAPKKLALPHYREWEKAFKYINLKTTSSNNKYIFDEDKTVEYIANTKIFDLKFKKVQEKKFSLTIIIDQHKTMEIWSELIKLFKQMLYTFGVFNQISIYYWDTNSKNAKLYYDKRLKQKADDKNVIIDNKQNLIWIMSDCLAPSWKSGDSFKKIKKWSKYSLTSIMQMFPKRMWMGTMLYKGKHTRVSSKNFSSLNHELICNTILNENKDSLKIPIVSFDPFALQAWAKVVINREKNSINGVVFDDLEFEEIKKTKSKISLENRMKRFYLQTSPIAQELAFYISVLPVDFQVVRILQENKLPNSNQSHVAELFLGGLVERIEKDGKTRYDFYPKVREELNQNIGADESIEILKKMSDFLSSHLGVGFDIKALLSDPSGAFKGDIELSDESIAYAKLVSNVIQRAGGRYADIAKEIENSIKKIEDDKFLQELQEKLIKKLQETEVCEHVGEEVYIGDTPKDGGYISGIVTQCGDTPENIEILSVEKIENSFYKAQAKFDLNSYVELHDYSYFSFPEEKEFELDIECSLDVILKDNEIVELMISNLNIDMIDWSQLDEEYFKEEKYFEEEETKAIIPTSKRFQMGSNEYDDEKPVHEVVINYDFEIAKYPVTFEEYDLFCEDTGKEKPDDEGWGRGKRPVINVSWHDAKEYCKWLSEKTEENYRLPTEAEWEYSCRAGTTTKWSFGDEESKLKEYAWYWDNSGQKTHLVGEKKPNPWGLYDMHGNVWEWCEDWYIDNYKDTPRDGKANESGKKEYKVLRGGSWFSSAGNSRSADRNRDYPAYRNNYVGFRLLRTLPS